MREYAGIAALAGALALGRGAPAVSVDETAIRAGDHGALVVLEPEALEALERRGLTMGALMNAAGEDGASLARTPRYRSLVETIESDLRELGARPGVLAQNESKPGANHPFRAAWLRSERARFELVGAVNRIDRAFAAPNTCGEARLVYRLALHPNGRPETRLPMTMNVVFTQPRDANGGCAAIAKRWIDLPRSGAARADGVASLFAALGAYERVEIDVQNLHGASVRADEDDHAEYLLRVFDVHRGACSTGARDRSGCEGDRLEPRALFNTPREDLGAEERAELAAWVASSFDAIDDGTAVVPEKFLATRAISVTPRGLARPRNRVFKRLLNDEPSLAALPYERATLARSQAALLRRLDEGTCAGCHQSRSIAGFHLLGEERDARATFNALAVGSSPHFREELAWREEILHRFARGEDAYAAGRPRPFAGHADARGGYGAHCGLGDAGFASWTCAPGLRCRDVNHDEVGICVPEGGNSAGDACQNVSVVARAVAADGDAIVPRALERCKGGPDASCSPNAFGFAGGACSDACATLGEVSGAHVCADIPASGFESECFAGDEPIEACLARHVERRTTRACSADAPCRDDFACARVPGAPSGTGACVPPYFVFQARVDGPLLDR